MTSFLKKLRFKTLPGHVLRFWVSITGLMLVSFVVVHLFGNMLVLFGEEVFLAYVAKLHSMPLALLVLRISLGLCFLIHIRAIMVLGKKNKAARLVDYKKVTVVGATPESYSARRNGIVILLFIILHLAHVKIVKHIYKDLYEFLTAQFYYNSVTVLYIMGLWQLKKHLSYSLSGVAQTFGIMHLRPSFFKSFTTIFVRIIFLLYISIPILMYLGLYVGVDG